MRGAVLRSVKVSRYTYQVYYIGSSQWQPQYCDGNGCHNLRAAVNMLMNHALPYVVLGAESGCLSCPIGTVLTENNRYNKGGANTWTYWCYSVIRRNVDGTITSCNTTNHSWTVKYPK